MFAPQWGGGGGGVLIKWKSPIHLFLPGTLGAAPWRMACSAVPRLSSCPRLRTQPPASSNPQTFADVILGTCWINDPEVQSFCIKFLSGLKEARAALLLSV